MQITNKQPTKYVLLHAKKIWIEYFKRDWNLSYFWKGSIRIFLLFTRVMEKWVGDSY